MKIILKKNNNNNYSSLFIQALNIIKMLFLFSDYSLINNWTNHNDTNEKSPNYFEYDQ